MLAPCGMTPMVNVGKAPAAEFGASPSEGPFRTSVASPPKSSASSCSGWAAWVVLVHCHVRRRIRSMGSGWCVIESGMLERELASCT